MPKTPNHGYNVPNEGAQDWHTPLNKNFRQYDTDIEIRDKLSTRGNYEPKAGAKFFAIDTGLVLLGDGSNWNPVSATGPAPTFEQAVFDHSNPLVQFLADGENLAEFSGETAGDAGRFLISLYGTDGKRSTILSANRKNHIGIGGIGSVPLDIEGRNNWNLNNGDGDVRIGNDDYRLAMGVALKGGGAGACNIRAKGGIKRLNLGAGTNGHTVQVDENDTTINGDLTLSKDGSMNIWWDASGDDYIRTYVDMQEKEFNWTFNNTSMGLTSDGEFYVSGSKNFVETVDTDDGEKDVVYTASEAPTPRTEVSDVARLEDGRVEIDLPEHFGWVTSDEEPLVVQTTPYGGERGLKVVERSLDRLVVEDLGGEGDYEFAYTVKGTREGHEDKQVVRDPNTTKNPDAPATPSSTQGTTEVD